MAWRNCQQAIEATIPQLMLTDENANAFMQALIQAGSSSSAKTAAYNTYIKPLLVNTYCQSTALISEKIAGDDRNYINCTVEGSFATFYFYYNGTQLTLPLLSEGKSNNWVCAYISLVDDENQVGYWQGFQVLITNPLNASSFGGSQPAYSGESAQKVYTILTVNEYVPAIVANGGGATHIAKVTGQLKDLSSYTSDILMVSGGGGGGLLVGEDAYAGKDAGGIAGSGNNSANQTTGYAFGQGESGSNVSGGGGGYYGGYKGGTS